MPPPSPADSEVQLLAAIRSLTLVMSSLQKTSEGIGVGRGAGAIRPQRFTGAGVSVSITRKQQVALDNFTGSMRDGSIVFKNFLTTMNTLKSDVDLAAGAFGTLLSSAETFRELNRVAARTVSSFEKSNSSILRSVASQIKTADDLDAAQTRLEGLKGLQEVLKDSTASVADNVAAIKAAGYGDVLRDLTRETKDVNKALDIFERDIKQAGVDIGRFVSKAAAIPGGPGGGIGGMLKGSKSIIGAVINEVKGFGKMALDAIGLDDMQKMAEAAIRFGTTVNFTTATLAGMKPEELSEEYAKHQRALNMLGSSYANMDALILQGQETFRDNVATTPEATKLTLGLADSFSMMGGKADDVNAYLEEQSIIYDKFRIILGTTAEEFLALTDTLQKDSKTRRVLLGLGKTERLAYLNSLKMWQFSMQRMGVTAETAASAMDAMSNIQDLNVNDLYKQSFNIAALAQHAGLGKTTEEIVGLREDARLGDKTAEAELLDIYKNIGIHQAKMEQEARKSGSREGKRAALFRSEYINTLGEGIQAEIQAGKDIGFETFARQDMTAQQRIDADKEQAAKAEIARLGEIGVALNAVGVTQTNMDYLKNLQQIKTASDLSYALQVKMLAELERPGWYGEAIEATSSMMGGPLSNVIDYIQGNTEWQKQGQVEQLKFQNKQHEEAIKELQNPGWITKLVASEEEQNRQLTEKQKQMADNQAKINELLGIVTQQLEKANTEGENRTKVNQQAAKTAAAHLEETKKGNVACEEAAKNAAEAAKVGVKYGGQPRNCAAVGG